MRITKVYTKTGDDGSTGLVGGTRVPKHDPRLETYGTVDELSSSLGLIRAELYRCAGDFSDEGDRTLLDRHIAHLQNELFDLGTELATEREARWPDMRRVDEASVAYLESLLDAYAETLPPLKDFVIPAGNAVVANFHLARCIARRAERRVAQDPELLGGMPPLAPAH